MSHNNDDIGVTANRSMFSWITASLIVSKGEQCWTCKLSYITNLLGHLLNMFIRTFDCNPLYLRGSYNVVILSSATQKVIDYSFTVKLNSWLFTNPRCCTMWQCVNQITVNCTVTQDFDWQIQNGVTVQNETR